MFDVMSLKKWNSTIYDSLDSLYNSDGFVCVYSQNIYRTNHLYRKNGFKKENLVLLGMNFLHRGICETGLFPVYISKNEILLSGQNSIQIYSLSNNSILDTYIPRGKIIAITLPELKTETNVASFFIIEFYENRYHLITLFYRDVINVSNSIILQIPKTENFYSGFSSVNYFKYNKNEQSFYAVQRSEQGYIYCCISF
jgi:hypothetical protein